MRISLFFHISLSYSLQSPSEFWSEAVRSSLPSPSIHPFISHLPTALPSGHTSLHPPPLHLNLPPCYLWEYADGANPGKDGIYLSYIWGQKQRLEWKRDVHPKGGTVDIQLITKLSFVLKSKAIHQKKKKNKGKERGSKKNRGGWGGI